MTKTKLIILSLSLLSLLPSCATSDAATDGYVYVCTGPTATKYHLDPDCKGLNRCSDRVVKTTKSKTGRQPCKICAE